MPALALAYSLLKPCRSTLHFWLPYYMRVALGYADGTVASCLMVYDLGSLFGGVIYSAALDSISVRRPLCLHSAPRPASSQVPRFRVSMLQQLPNLLAPLALLLALLLLGLNAAATLGPLAFAATLALIGTTFGGLELMSSGSAAGCVVDAVGGSSQATLPAIVGAVSGFGSLASMVGVSLVSTLLDRVGWLGIFRFSAASALLSALVLIFALRGPAFTSGGRRSSGGADALACDAGVPVSPTGRLAAKLGLKWKEEDVQHKATRPKEE